MNFNGRGSAPSLGQARASYFQFAISRFESSRPNHPFMRSARLPNKRESGPEIPALREFASSPDSQFADFEVEVAESLRP